MIPGYPHARSVTFQTYSPSSLARADDGGVRVGEGEWLAIGTAGVL